MKIGIIGNTEKKAIAGIIDQVIQRGSEMRLEFAIDDSLRSLMESAGVDGIRNYLPVETLPEASDILMSVGGDGTMLTTAYTALMNDMPIIGINFGKLGFLSEAEIGDIDDVLEDLYNDRFTVEERMVLTGKHSRPDHPVLHAINDIVIDRGSWPKMVELTIHANDEYVTTFSADGVIIATPTGTTGYNLSVGGPIVYPQADVITLSPISAHSLSIRPLVLHSSMRITITVEHHSGNVQVNSDGQRVHMFSAPMKLQIARSEKPLKVIKTKSKGYFEILRSKLLWGVDVRGVQRNNYK